MATRSAIRLDGDRRLIRKLAKMNIPDKDVKRVMREPAKKMKNTAQSLVPVDEGLLKRSIKVATLKGGKKKPATLAIRPEYRSRAGKNGATRSAGFHAHLVEYGTRLRPATKDGGSRVANLNGQRVQIDNTGTMPARPFMRPTWDRHKHQARRAIWVGLWRLVQAKGKKGGKK